MKVICSEFIVKPFISGFLATFAFHQGLFSVFYLLGLNAQPPYNLMPTAPFGVPSVLSLAFFGGLWGILIWQAVRSRASKIQLVGSVILGAIGPTAVAFLVVFPLKGIEVDARFIPAGLLLNAAWGLGLWLFMRLFRNVA